MPNKMLIDATHPEETRVVVLRGNRVEEFDFESANRKQLRGNIYLAKVTRVEPSLQAAFVDIGQEKAAFMHVSELVGEAGKLDFDDPFVEVEDKAPEVPKAKRSSSKPTRRHIGKPSAPPALMF